jgi:ubiquinone/menaquinone biosynthesis C-methylase UbiE
MQRVPERELMDSPRSARAYAEADFADVNEAFVERLLELAPGQAVWAVDLGTGPADIPIRVVKKRAGWRIIGIEGSAEMLRIAQEAIDAAGVSDRILLSLADVKETKLPDHTVEMIFSNTVLHHLPDPHPFWREIKRLAKPGAVVFVRDLMRPSSEVTAKRVVELYAEDESELLQQEFYNSLLAAFRPDEVRQQLDAAGLESLQVQPATDRHMDVFGTL